MSTFFLTITLRSIKALSHRIDSPKINGLEEQWVRNPALPWYPRTVLTQMVQWAKIKSPLFYSEIKTHWPLDPLEMPTLQHCVFCFSTFYCFFFFLTFKNDVCLPPSLPRFQVSPSVHSSLEPKARNSCLPHRPHFPPLLPSSSLEPSLLWMLLCEFPVWWVKTLGQPNENHTSGHSLQGKSILELTAPPPQTDH